MTDLEEVLTAKTDELRLSSLVTSYKPWILRCASETVHRYVTEHDDEWSIALQAFNEAVQSYEEDKGPFKVFATVVIRRRILDYIRSESRHNAELSVNPAAFGGDLPEEETDGISLQVRQEVAERSEEASDDGPAQTREEITAVQATFSRYGFSFFDLTECSPRAEKTKRACAQAVRALLENETLLAQMRQKRMLPVKDIVKLSGVSDKVLDRHRRYIIAAAEIISGDYPILSAYLDFIRKV